MQARQWIHSTAAMAAFLDEEVEAHGARFRALGADAMADRLLGISTFLPTRAVVGVARQAATWATNWPPAECVTVAATLTFTPDSQGRCARTLRAIHAELAFQPHQPLARPLDQPGVGLNITAFGCAVVSRDFLWPTEDQCALWKRVSTFFARSVNSAASSRASSGESPRGTSSLNFRHTKG
jgi:hypothetical protein